VLTRRLLLKAARDYAANGNVPGAVRDPETGMIRPLSLTLEEDADWRESRDTVMKAEIGTGFGYVP